MHLSLIIFLIFFVSCGKTKGPYDESYPMMARAEQEGYYRASLESVNGKISRRNFGKSSVFLRGNQFYAKVKLDTGRPHVTYLQGIHEGDRCPDPEDDINRDGYIDGQEALRVSGRMLIPLDGDLTRQLKSFSIWPKTNKKGLYLYTRSVGVDAIMGELRSISFRSHQLLTRLGSNEELNLTHRVMIVYGVPYSYTLPETVEGVSGFPPHMSVPIACGRFVESEEEFPFI